MKISTKNFISVLVLSIAVFFLGFATAKMMPEAENGPASVVQNEPVQTMKTADKVSVMVDYSDGIIRTSPEISWKEGESVYDALKLFAEQAAIDLKVKDYGGDMGVFVEAIDGKQDPKKKAWWQYWVNNEYGKIGSSSYKLKAGDVVMWKLISSEQ